MKRLLSVFCAMIIVLIATSLYDAKRPSADGPEYTDAQIKNMIREAHTTEQYSVFADYCAARQGIFKRNAAEEMHLWNDRNSW